MDVFFLFPAGGFFSVANLSDREAGQRQSPKEGRGATEREAERTTVQDIAYEYHRISILYIYIYLL